jgi:hypothetical protein
MCITLHASRLSATKIYAGETEIDGKYHHVLAYKNNATNKFRGANAMVLPIPSAAPLGAKNAYDTREFKGFLNDIADSTKALTLSEDGFGKDRRSRGLSMKGISVFDVGSYTVVVGTKMSDAMAAVGTLPIEKRPSLNPQVLSAMAELYPGWAFAFCCWNSTKELEAEPLLFAYEPKAPGLLFAPGLDSHDGQPPRTGDVSVDHIITFGSTLKPTGRLPIEYKSAFPENVRSILPTYAVGERLRGSMPNGDFWYPVSSLNGHADHDQEPLPATRFFPGPSSLKTEVPLGTWS